MPNMDLFSGIHANHERLTKAKRKVADYILEHPKEVLYMSITDLADTCKVSDASVFRFCRTLGLQGYQEFKLCLAQGITPGENGTTQFFGQINVSDSPDTIAKKILAASTDALDETFEHLAADDVTRAVDFMTAANRISFFGVGSSLITALEAADEFLRITPKVDCIFDSHLQTMRASLLTEEDLAVVISYSGSTMDMIEIAKICKNSGVKVICITGFEKSPLTFYADLTLLCGANEGPIQRGSITAKISQFYLLHVLYAQYFLNTLELSKENRKKTAEAVLQKLY